MVNEKYFEKLEAKHINYWYIAQPDAAREIVGLAREISKYTDEEKKVTRIVNSLRRAHVISVNDLLVADIDEIAKVRNIGNDALNIIRQIKGLPIVSEDKLHPFAKKYRVDFYNHKKGGNFHKSFTTLKQLHDYFDAERNNGTIINYISEEVKE